MTTRASQTRNVVGVMTGTSIDGMDVALARITGTGLALRAELIAHAAQPFGEMGQTLRQMAAGEPMTAERIARTAWAFGELHAEVIHAMLAEYARTDPLDLIAVHGQTTFHQPPISWQLVNAAPIAARFDCPVVFDLRQADLAAGGQGAPITPIADWIMFRDAARRRAIVNLGGFCNITILPPAVTRPSRSCDEDTPPLEDIHGFDLCACNHLLDAIARRMLNAPYDDGGRAALAGNVNDAAAHELLRILNSQHAAHRSLGTGDECASWLAQHIDSLSGPDLAASATWAIGHCISNCLGDAAVDETILAGGGACNDALVTSIRSVAAASVTLSNAHGIPCEAREALAIAILGALTADRVPITLPHITGCRTSAPVAGAWMLP